MSFVRQDRHRSSKKTQSKAGGRAKKGKKRAPAWDGTTSDLSVHRLSKSELERRREIHKSSNLPAVKAERQMRSLIRGGSHHRGDMDRSHLLQEILYDEAQLRDAVGYSDRIMSVVHDLFGDDPNKKAGRANVTLAPGTESEKRAAKMLPDMTLNPSQLDILSDSVMDPQALNEVDVDDEYSDEDSCKENTPEAYKGALDLERFRRYIEKESENKYERKTLRVRRQNNERAGRRGQKHREPLKETHHNDLSDDGSGTEAQEATRVQAINDTAKVKKKSRARTAGGDTTPERANRDLARVIHGVQREVKEYERETGEEILPPRDMSSGTTVVLVQTIQALLRHLTQKEIVNPDASSFLAEKVEEQSNLINALTLELMSTQERLSRLEGQLLALLNNNGQGPTMVTPGEPPSKPSGFDGGSLERPVTHAREAYSTTEQAETDINPGHMTLQSAGRQQPPQSASGMRRSTGGPVHTQTQADMNSLQRPQPPPAVQRPQLRSETGHQCSEGSLEHSRKPTNQPGSSAESVQENHSQPDSMQSGDYDVFTAGHDPRLQASSSDTHQGTRVVHSQVTRRVNEDVFTTGQAILLSPPRQRDRHSLFTAQGSHPMRGISGGGRQANDVIGGGRQEVGMSQNAWSSAENSLSGVQRWHRDDMSEGAHPHGNMFSNKAGDASAKMDAVEGGIVSVQGTGNTAELDYTKDRPRPLINPFKKAGGGNSGVSVGPNDPNQGEEPHQRTRQVSTLNPRMTEMETISKDWSRKFVGSDNLQTSDLQMGPIPSENDRGPRDGSLLSIDSCSTYHSLPQAQVPGNPALAGSIPYDRDLSGSEVFAVPNQEWDVSSSAGAEFEETEAGAVRAISDLTRKIEALTKEHAEAEERLQNLKS